MAPLTAIQPRNPSSLYFGKISSRGDFVKSASGARVIALIDSWAAQGMELLIANPGWKPGYDNAGPIDFLFLGTRRTHAICGALAPSCDASARRFPFIAATLFEVDDALAFLPLSPLVMERHASRQRALAQHAAATHDAADTLAALGENALQVDSDQGKCRSGYAQFLARTSIAALADALALDDTQASLRQMVLATGYLLQPVLSNYAVAPQRGLALPLPSDPALAAPVRAWWLDLVCTFLPRADFELSVFSCRRQGRPTLIITFNGTTPAVFHALFEPDGTSELFIDIAQAAWVEECAARDAATFKLSSYLEHDALTLHQLMDTFRQGFSG
ncbi:MAG TPA: type VI secretion system-associated protein TagF [Noviherbaspirillum sp.]|nr:type VI secretion system-associated protein TagF [Noviherbaspirillum sp.]